MTFALVAMSLVAAALVLAAGWLFGIRRGTADRIALRAEVERGRAEMAARDAELSSLRVTHAAEVAQLHRATSSMPVVRNVDEEREALRQQIDGTLRSVLGPLLERESAARELRSSVEGLLRPMVERERLASELSRLEVGDASRAALKKLLDAIAGRGGFSTVLLTDDSGLPLAASGREDSETLSATTALLLQFADRAVRAGEPAPVTIALRDSARRTAMHRIFSVQSERYVLTVVSSGGFLPPDVLDPAIARIERALAQRVLDA